MKFRIKTITLSILAISFIACNGQKQEKNKAPKLKNVLEVPKIAVPKNGFSSAYLDKDSSLWFGSNGGGIYHYDGKNFKNYTEQNGLSSNQVFSTVADHENNLWFGTQNGLTKYTRKQFEHIPIPYQDTTSGWIAKVYPVLNPNSVHALATDDDNN